MLKFKFININGVEVFKTFSVAPITYPITNGSYVVNGDIITGSSPETLDLIPNTFKVELNHSCSNNWYIATADTSTTASSFIVSGSYITGSLVNVVFNLQDHVSNPSTIKNVELKAINENIGFNDSFVLEDSLTAITDGLGSFTVSLVPQAYNITFKGIKRFTKFKINVPNTGSTVNAKDLIVTSANVSSRINIKNQSEMAYTAATSDLRYIQSNGAIASASYSNYAVTASYAHNAGGNSETASYGVNGFKVGGKLMSGFASASGANSVALGGAAYATADESFAFGANTLASSPWALAHGVNNTASNFAAHAEGQDTKALGFASHTDGIGTIASGSYQNVVGKYNKQGNSTSLFIVGGGTSTVARADILAVNSSNVVVSGSINVSGSITSNGVVVSGSINVSGSVSAIIISSSAGMSVGGWHNGLVDSTNTHIGNGLTTTHNNQNTVRIGYQTGFSSTTSSNSVQIGHLAGQNATLATNVVQIGQRAGAGSTTASVAVQIGTNAGQFSSQAEASTMVGTNSGRYAFTGSRGTLIGYYAGGESRGNVADATMVGYQSGYEATNSSGSTMVGAYSGLVARTSSYSTLMGAGADAIAATSNIEKSIAIGFNAKVSGSRQCVIGGTGNDSVKVSIGGNSAINTLDVVGNISCSVITASLFGSASFANNAVSASYLSGSNAIATQITASNPHLYTSYTVGNVVSAGATEVFGAYNLYSGGNQYIFTIYAYKNTPDGRVYSATPYVLDIYDTAAEDYFRFNLSWTAVTGADGYRIVVYDDSQGVHDDFSVDVAGTNFNYNGYGDLIEDVVVTPSSPLTILTTRNTALFVNGDSKLSGSNFVFGDINQTGSLSVNGDMLVKSNVNASKIQFDKTNGTLKFTGIGSYDTLFELNGTGASGDFIFRRAASSAYSTLSFLTTTTRNFYISNFASDGTFRIASDSLPYIVLNTGKVGIGHTAPSAMLHTISTTEQSRIGYNTSNYLSTTIASNGNATFDLIGTNPKFIFSDNAEVTGSLSVTGSLNINGPVTYQNSENTFFIKDEFCGIQNSSTPSHSELGWVLLSSGSAPTIRGNAYNTYPNIGVCQLSCGATAGSSAITKFPINGASGNELFAGVDQRVGLELTEIFRLENTSSVLYRVGMVSNSTTDLTGESVGAYLRFDSARTTSSFAFVYRNGASWSSGSSTILPALNTWYKLKIRCNAAGTLSYSLNNETPVTLTGSWLSGASVGPMRCVITNEAAAKTIYTDYFSMSFPIVR